MNFIQSKIKNFIQSEIKNFKLSRALMALGAMIFIAFLMLASGTTNALVIGVPSAVIVWVLAMAWNAYSTKQEAAAQEADIISIAGYRNAPQDMEVAA